MTTSEPIDPVVAALAGDGPPLPVENLDAYEPVRRDRPILDPKALYGITGELLEAIESEADPAALVVSFLVGVGNLIGQTPRIVQPAVHTAGTFAVIVGATSKARKGTSWNAIRPFLEAADPEWFATRIMDGFGSGEILIDQVADPDPDDDGNVGQRDKRLLVMAPEFAKLLTTCNRDVSTLSPIVRQAWDGDRLEARSRQHGNKVATGAHLGFLGHITEAELRSKLTATDSANGFANRFLFVAARRSRSLPFGGRQPDPATVADIGRRIRQAKDDAIRHGTYQWSDAARPKWTSLYREMDADEPGGLLEAVTSRDAAQTLRLALLYAILDRSPVIDAVHLDAAYAVWRYCRESAAFIFGDAIGDELADKLLRVIRRAGPEGCTGDELRKGTKATSAARRAQVLDDLERLGRIRRETTPTGGRPETRYYPVDQREGL